MLISIGWYVGYLGDIKWDLLLPPCRGADIDQIYFDAEDFQKVWDDSLGMLQTYFISESAHFGDNYLEKNENEYFMCFIWVRIAFSSVWWNHIQGSQGWEYGKSLEFNFGLSRPEKFRNLPRWLGILFIMFIGNINIKILNIYRFDHNLNVTQVIGIKFDENIWQRWQIYKQNWLGKV